MRYILAFTIILFMTSCKRENSTDLSNYFTYDQNNPESAGVKMKDGTEVEFWKDGSYREVDGGDKPIPTDFIPNNIKEYVGKNHPNEKITHIDYGHKDLDVDLTNNIDLEFTKEGKILKDKKNK